MIVSHFDLLNFNFFSINIIESKVISFKQNTNRSGITLISSLYVFCDNFFKIIDLLCVTFVLSIQKSKGYLFYTFGNKFFNLYLLNVFFFIVIKF